MGTDAARQVAPTSWSNDGGVLYRFLADGESNKPGELYVRYEWMSLRSDTKGERSIAVLGDMYDVVELFKRWNTSNWWYRIK